MNNVKLPFPNDLHKFEKISKRKNKEQEHKYVCSVCGVEAYKTDDGVEYIVRKGNKKAIELCGGAGVGSMTEATMKNPNIGREIMISKDITIDEDTVIPQTSVFKVVECPESHKKTNNMSTWIELPGGGLMLLLEDEYSFMEEPEEEPEEVLVEIVGNEEDAVYGDTKATSKEVSPDEEPEDWKKEVVEEVEIDNEAIIEKSNQQADEHMAVIDAGEAEFQKEEEEEEEPLVITEPLPTETIEKMAKACHNLKAKAGVVKANCAIEFKLGRYHLEDSDRLEYALKLSEAEHQISILKDELSGISKKYKDKIKDQQAILTAASEAIRNGFEDREIACELYYDYDQNRRLWRSKDNSNVVKIEEMKPSDYQLELSTQNWDEMKEIEK